MMEWLKVFITLETGLPPEALARRLRDCGLRSAPEDRFEHADLHLTLLLTDDSADAKSYLLKGEARPSGRQLDVLAEALQQPGLRGQMDVFEEDGRLIRRRYLPNPPDANA